MAPDTLKKSKLTLAITLTSLTKSGGLNLYLGFDRNYSITSVQIMFYGFISIVFFLNQVQKEKNNLSSILVSLAAIKITQTR